VSEIFNQLNTSPIAQIIAFIFGALCGSFFNVCIIRIPEDEDIVFKSSHCRKCSYKIPGYLNIPILSYIFLRGKCANCKASISIQYPLVELFSAIMFVCLSLAFGLGFRFWIYGLFISALIIISVIDLYHRIIPDSLSLPGIVVGFLLSFFLKEVIWWESLIGILLGGGSFLAVAYIYEVLAKREGLGGGDVKLLAMIGAWLGYQSILPVIIISSALGSVVGVSLLFAQKGDMKTAIPFGPFLSFAAGIYVFYGRYIQLFLFPDLR